MWSMLIRHTDGTVRNLRARPLGISAHSLRMMPKLRSFGKRSPSLPRPATPEAVSGTAKFCRAVRLPADAASVLVTPTSIRAALWSPALPALRGAAKLRLACATDTQSSGQLPSSRLNTAGEASK